MDNIRVYEGRKASYFKKISALLRRTERIS